MRLKTIGLALLWSGSSGPFTLFAQTLLSNDGSVRLNTADMSVLETPDSRKDLPCSVTPSKADLGFDLRFHVQYDVAVPLSEIGEHEDQLLVIFRVTRLSSDTEPRFLMQRFHVPRMADNSRGRATLSGSMQLGEGKYHIDWLMRNRAGYVCSFHWNVEAALPSKDRQIQLALAPGSVEGADDEQFSEEPPVERAPAGQALNIKVVVDFAPQNPDSATLDSSDIMALVTVLRQIAREPRFGRFSVVAYNVQQEKVLYRQASEDRINFPALGQGVQTLKLATVDYHRLRQKDSETKFLSGLIRQEVSGEHPDALIFAGPKITLNGSVPDDQLKSLTADLDFPVFYMNYNLNPQANPWKDSLASAVRLFKGTEYTISRPLDVWYSVRAMVSRINATRPSRRSK
jgi:hypothetical protein